ncbi:uncharacterized protein ACA1_356130 [Acanthamoeba castellanii str. Neff]|uniref:Uncharacterized protein n=1 Tax=Acanthamoeba castellanii (strain ATCC 30010 / Neff) TaxID=1257118 RepID=L8HGD0_ACACF|nr:uncharacterized protein ACA1_356130 [Acanthamoeba castellanii str. Neff]ELR24312.1 hypothetical protein ACA1_356130 [Acanthamoeba castellanii str. Neff]
MLAVARPSPVRTTAASTATYCSRRPHARARSWTAVKSPMRATPSMCAITCIWTTTPTTPTPTARPSSSRSTPPRTAAVPRSPPSPTETAITSTASPSAFRSTAPAARLPPFRAGFPSWSKPITTLTKAANKTQHGICSHQQERF